MGFPARLDSRYGVDSVGYEEVNHQSERGQSIMNHLPATERPVFILIGKDLPPVPENKGVRPFYSTISNPAETIRAAGYSGDIHIILFRNWRECLNLEMFYAIWKCNMMKNFNPPTIHHWNSFLLLELFPFLEELLHPTERRGQPCQDSPGVVHSDP